MVTLYDARNRPIDMASLRREKRLHRSYSSAWEPITSGTEIDPTWIVNAIRGLERGDVGCFVNLARRMKERFDPYMGALGEVEDALGDRYRVTPASKAKVDQDVADAARRVLESDEFRLALVDVRDAIGVGYSFVQMIWGFDAKGYYVPQRFLRAPQELFRWAEDGETPLVGSDHAGWWETLERGRFMCHVSRVRSGLPVNLGLAKSVAYLYLFESMALSGWGGYLERFGQPLIRGLHSPNENEDVIDELERVVQALATDGSVVHSDNLRIELLEHKAASGNATGSSGYGEFIRLIDKKVRIAVLGQDMTDTSGGSRALGEVLKASKTTRFRSFAFQESAMVRRDLVRPLIEANVVRGLQRMPPQVWLDIEDSADMKALADGLAPLVDRGAKVLIRWALDEAGIQIPPDLPDDAVLHPIGQPPEQAPSTTSEVEARARLYADTILRIVDETENVRDKRALGKRIRSLARDAGFDVKRAA